VTEGPDPERLLAQALRAQAASTPVPPAGPPPGGEQFGGEPGTEGTGGDARLVDLLSGAGHGLISGRDPSTMDVPYAGVPADRTGPVMTTALEPKRPQLAWWWMLLLAIALGVACGAIAGIVTLI
jgi:hypothetical protein